MFLVSNNTEHCKVNQIGKYAGANCFVMENLTRIGFCHQKCIKCDLFW